MMTRVWLVSALTTSWAGLVFAADVPNPYCVSGMNWAPNGTMVRLGMPGGVNDMNGSICYNWGSFQNHTRVALTNPSWRWTEFDRKPPFHSYDVEKNRIVDEDKTREWIAKHPGWHYIIGNEPDNPQLDAGDGMKPEQYARMYHLYYTFIKKTDPTATVVIAGQYAASFKNEVEADAKWWNQVLATYKKEFGQDMPIEVWNCHCYTPPGHADPERIIKEFFIPYRTYVDTVADGRYAHVPLWCTEFGIAVWAGLATPDYMAEFAQQLCPRLEKEYKLPTGKTKVVCDRFFWFLGPYSAKWADMCLMTKGNKTPSVTGKAYARMARGWPNPIPPKPVEPRLATKKLRFHFDKTTRPFHPMAGDWELGEGAYRQTRIPDGWGIRSHLPDFYKDFQATVDVKINEAREDTHWAGIQFRHSTFWQGGIRGYLVYLRKNGEVGLSVVGSKKPVLAVPNVVADTSQWHKLGLKAVGPDIEITLDDKSIAKWTDPKPHRTAGLFSLASGKADSSFDNLLIEPIAR